MFDRYEPDAFLSENASTVTMHLTPYVKALVDRGADINVLSENGMSMLHRACGEGNVDCVRVLLECGANVNLPTVKGVPAIHMARRHNDADTVLTVIRLLCHHGADPAATINGKDPMIVLSKEEHWSKIVVCLLGNGMVKDWSRYDKTLVEYASKRTAKVFLDGTRNGDQQMVHDSLRAKVYLLTAEDGSVRDDCAVSLIRALDEHGHLLSEETGKMVQKALSEYIEKYEPSSTLRSFIAIYNAEELREEALSELADAKLKPVGIREDFGVIGNYSPADGLSLIKLARSWLINSKEDHMVYVMAILKYVAEKAVQPEKASRAVRVKLHNAVVALLAEVAHSGIPTLEERASHIRDFLGRAPFALDGLN